MWDSEISNPSVTHHPNLSPIQRYIIQCKLTIEEDFPRLPKIANHQSSIEFPPRSIELIKLTHSEAREWDDHHLPTSP
ncbi:MAG: hypothetical protein J7641_02870 [Cyanobacteria bacterium SID2]|nr:hypothetical protein [Cyanobacteria bacterium SID2]